MRYRIHPLLAAAVVLLPAYGQSNENPASVPMKETPPGAGIPRTMTLLATSTPERRNRVKILFYGQSITEQAWSRAVADDLRRRFPHADLVIENRAIGGFASPVLVRTAEHDLYPFYPDLVIFHVYGGEPEYEEIVRNVRRRTTAEMLLQSDHLAAGQQNDPKGAAWHDRHSNIWLPEIARTYGVGFADIREPWRRYLTENRLEVGALLSDGVHLNDRGNALMASLVTTHLRHDPAAPTDPWKGMVRDYVIGKDIAWKDGRLTLTFTGNRVDALAAAGDPAPAAAVRIDGRKPSAFPELYAITRPSQTLGVGWPAILRVGWEKPLVVEDWTLRVTAIDPATRVFQFTVAGSKTGADGAGGSDRRFVSDSGRVVIEPRDWWVENARRFTGKEMPVGYEVTWRVSPLFVDTYLPPRVEDPTRESATTLAQGLRNERHTLEIVAEDGKTPPIRALRVYEPPLK